MFDCETLLKKKKKVVKLTADGDASLELGVADSKGSCEDNEELHVVCEKDEVKTNCFVNEKQVVSAT